MVDAAVTAMAYSALELTTSQAPFFERDRPYAVGEVSSGYATSLDIAGGFVVKFPKSCREPCGCLSGDQALFEGR
jgi:hypothetical protein